MKTYTGRWEPRPLPVGRCTLTKRQFSELVRAPLVLARAVHLSPYWVAALTPVHGRTGWGARHRRAPTGGAAYGMPRKLSTPSARAPRTAPLSVTTTSDEARWDAGAFAAGAACPAH